MGMTDDRVNVIVYNAFNGFGDVVGEDDFGYSVAWIDLDDYVEMYDAKLLENLPEGTDRNDTDSISAWLKTWRDVNGSRWVLAYLDSDGSRSAIGYSNQPSMMKAFKEHEEAYNKWFNETEA